MCSRCLGSVCPLRLPSITHCEPHHPLPTLSSLSQKLTVLASPTFCFQSEPTIHHGLAQNPLLPQSLHPRQVQFPSVPRLVDGQLLLPCPPWGIRWEGSAGPTAHFFWPSLHPLRSTVAWLSSVCVYLLSMYAHVSICIPMCMCVSMACAHMHKRICACVLIPPPNLKQALCFTSTFPTSIYEAPNPYRHPAWS